MTFIVICHYGIQLLSADVGGAVVRVYLLACLRDNTKVSARICFKQRTTIALN